MMRFGSTLQRTTWGLLLCACAVPALAADDTGAPAPIDASNPGNLIQSAASAMLKDLDAHRADYKKDPGKVHRLVDQILLPHFDTEYSARLVLGRHWNTANPDQRKRFIDAFYKSLLSNYGDALVDFTSDRLKVFPYTGDANAQYATVRTQVRKDDGTQVSVNYGLHKTDQGWKAWDVVIEGISYVKSFRDDFGAEIDQKGLDEVIGRLEAGDKPAAIKGGGSGKS
ncbi:MAG TPA: ABC transporter substrate-binding protein [Steroidobacteraceae bacterium]|jgi:phospholipid transport system substrate-binding protein|nr:ABC transporter substrate-binding protein [Steroidobacteraceae bacterium]